VSAAQRNKSPSPVLMLARCGALAHFAG